VNHSPQDDLEGEAEAVAGRPINQIAQEDHRGLAAATTSTTNITGFLIIKPRVELDEGGADGQATTIFGSSMVDTGARFFLQLQTFP